MSSEKLIGFTMYWELEKRDDGFDEAGSLGEGEEDGTKVEVWGCYKQYACRCTWKIEGGELPILMVLKSPEFSHRIFHPGRVLLRKEQCIIQSLCTDSLSLFCKAFIKAVS